MLSRTYVIFMRSSHSHVCVDVRGVLVYMCIPVYDRTVLQMFPVVVAAFVSAPVLVMRETRVGIVAAILVKICDHGCRDVLPCPRWYRMVSSFVRVL